MKFKKKTQPTSNPNQWTIQKLLCGKEGSEIDATTLTSEQVINDIIRLMNTYLLMLCSWRTALFLHYTATCIFNAL